MTTCTVPVNESTESAGSSRHPAMPPAGIGRLNDQGPLKAFPMEMSHWSALHPDIALPSWRNCRHCPVGPRSSGIDDSKMRGRSIARGHGQAHTAFRCRQASRTRPRERQEIRVGDLTMARELDAAGERSRHAIDVTGPDSVTMQGADVAQQGERRNGRNRIRGERGGRMTAGQTRAGSAGRNFKPRLHGA